MWLLQLRKKEKNNDVVLNGDFPSTDSEVETSETATESDILENEKNKKHTVMNCTEDEVGEYANDHYSEISKPSHDEILT